MLFRTFLAPTSFVAAVMWTIWAQAAEPITVLAPFNLTGPQAVLGAPCYRGAELAVEKLNAAGGVLGRRIELIPIDTASEVSRTTNELESALERYTNATAGIGYTDSTYALDRGAGISKGRNPVYHAGRYSAGPAKSGRLWHVPCGVRRRRSSPCNGQVCMERAQTPTCSPLGRRK